MKLLLIAMLFLFTACAGSSDVGGLFDKLEFKDGQEGCIRAAGQVAVGGNPFASSNINVSMVKKQGDNPPDC